MVVRKIITELEDSCPAVTLQPSQCPGTRRDSRVAARLA